MKLLDAMTILKVRKKAYILFHAGYKRMHKTYDVMAPDGSIIATSISYDDAVEVSQLHYVNSTPPPGRRSKIQSKKISSIELVKRNQSIAQDKTCLADYAEWAFDDSGEFDLK